MCSCAIYAEAPHDPVYDHGSWILAHVSSVRRYAHQGVTVAAFNAAS